MAGQVELSNALRDYVRVVSLREDVVLTELIEETARMPALAAMVVMPEEGQLLGLLVRLIGATRVLELGTFTGYSTLCMARALAPGGKIITCELNERWTRIARRYWERAGLAASIELRIGDATEVLSQLLDTDGPGSFDLVFVDADKASYPTYYEQALVHLRPGGLVVLDNTLYFGRVTDPGAQDPETRAIRELNETLSKDDRVDVSLLTMADGITLARKKDRQPATLPA
jgi:O-methyltransferase